MPTPISGNPLNYPASSTLPDDSATSVSQFNVPYGALFDRTAWANAALSPLATIAALKALDTTPIADGTVRLVDGFGFYVLRTASALAELQPWIVDPTTGPGRWLHVMNASKPTFKTQTFTTSGTFVLPDTAASADVLLIGYGGGGGGGAGCKSAQSPSGSVWGAGGGGGGGAVQGVARVTLVPGTTYDVAIGAGGAGGIGSLSSGPTLNGSDGGDTILSLSGVPQVTFRGAGGGLLGAGAITGQTNWGPGGVPVRSGGGAPTTDPSTTYPTPVPYWQLPPGAGGAGGEKTNTFAGHHGAASVQGFAGGAPGTSGANAISGPNTWIGGGPGGGGGGGPAGAGGAGGNGGIASSGSSAGPGTNGAAAAPNSGAGGGGGGSAGGGNTGTPPVGGSGGAGGSGRLTILWIGA